MDRWQRREKKLRKARYGMRVSGLSTKTVILVVIAKKAEKKPQKRR